MEAYFYVFLAIEGNFKIVTNEFIFLYEPIYFY